MCDWPKNCLKATQTFQNNYFKIFHRLYTGRFPKKTKDLLSREIQSKDVLIIDQVQFKGKTDISEEVIFLLVRIWKIHHSNLGCGFVGIKWCIFQ